MRSLPLATLLVSLAPLAAAASAQGDPIPFPVHKTTDLKEMGQVYTVEGRQVIPGNVKISSLRACTVRGVGSDATLVLEGPLDMRAVTGGRVRFENVWIEISPECKDLLLFDTDFVGGGIRTTEDTASRVKMLLIKVDFTGGASVRLTANDGKIEMQNSTFQELVEITGVPRSDKQGSNAVIQLEGCCELGPGPRRGFLGGLKVTGGKSVLVRNCDLGGRETTFTECPKLDLDGCAARSETTTFVQSEYGAFQKTKVGNCDVLTQLVFRAPPHPSDPDKAERLVLDVCYFGGRTDPDAIAAAMIRDRRRDPETSVLCTFTKIARGPIGVGGRIGG